MSIGRDGWTAVHLWREAVRNLYSRDSRLTLLLCLAVFAAASSVAFAALQWALLADGLERDGLSGRNTLVFQSADITVPTLIDRSSCEALARQPDVLRAGGINTIGPATFVQLGPATQVAAVSSTLLSDLADVDAVVGAALGFDGKNRRLITPDGHVLLASRGGSSPAGLDLGSTVAVPLGPEDTVVQRCIVTLDRFAKVSEAAPRLSSSLHSTGGILASTSEFSASTDPVEVFVARPDQFLPVALGVVCGVFGIGLNRFRSSDVASYRFSGTSKRSMFLLLFFEQALLAAAFAAAGSLALLLLAGFFVQPALEILWVLSGSLAWLVASLANAVFAGGDPSWLSKDR